MYSNQTQSNVKKARAIVYPTPRQGIKMNFFKRWLLNKLHNENTGQLVANEVRHIENEKAVRFIIHTASGGRVVETHRYDSHKDRNIQGLYVITENQNFGEEIAKIYTMEYLK